VVLIEGASSAESGACFFIKGIPVFSTAFRRSFAGMPIVTAILHNHSGSLTLVFVLLPRLLRGLAMTMRELFLWSV